MDDATNKFIVGTLRRVQANCGDLKSDVREVPVRFGNVGTPVAQLHVRHAGLSHRVERRVDTTQRVMRHLERYDVSHASSP